MNPPHRLRRRRGLPAAVAATLVALLLSACGGSGGTSRGSITLYSGQHQQTTQSLVSAFEKSTGIGVNVRYDDEDAFTDEIVAEKSHPRADVFYTENSPPLAYLEGKGLLAPVAGTTLATTPSRYDSPGGDWVGVSARVSVLIYNPRLIAESQLPTSVLGMADPRYKGKIAFAAGETDFQPIVTSVVRADGQAAARTWLEGLKANAGSHVYPDNETIADEVNRGSVAFGVVNQYYWYRMRAELGASDIHSAIAYFAPGDPGYVLDVSGAAVLSSSKHAAAAQRFVEFLVSRQGQQIIADSISYEYPLDHGVQPSASETPLDDLRPNAITVAQLGDGSMAVALLQRAGLL